jgi:hypothetical protein
MMYIVIIINDLFWTCSGFNRIFQLSETYHNKGCVPHPVVYTFVGAWVT